MPYHPNWKPVEQHALYWTCSTSLEHLVSFPAGGTSAVENLITSCYQCNDIKNRLPLALLGWDVAERVDADWDGLTGLLPELRAALARRGGGV